MLESNTFRNMMLIGGVMSLAVILACFFVTPIVEIDAQAKKNYENVMHATLDDDVDRLTGYQAIMYSIKGKTRGTTEHY